MTTATAHLNTTSALAAPFGPMAYAAPDKSEQALTIALNMIAEQQRRITQLENETVTDAMTGLMNKRGFMRALDRERNRASRTSSSNCILVMLDLDGLKQINDELGHLAGDAYISGFASALRSTVRGTDYIARLGGDEFAILLTDVDGTKGWARVETMMRSLNDKTVTHGVLALDVRVSHGSALVQPGMDADSIISEADGRLYDCKTVRKVQLRKDMEMIA